MPAVTSPIIVHMLCVSSAVIIELIITPIIADNMEFLNGFDVAK